jgi:hypothetical protein
VVRGGLLQVIPPNIRLPCFVRAVAAVDVGIRYAKMGLEFAVTYGVDVRETIRNGCVTASAGVALLGVFAPWLKSGESRRSSFELFELVDRLGFVPDGVFAWVLRLWPIVPLAVITCVVAAWMAKARIAGSLGLVGGIYVALVAVGIMQAPTAGLIRTAWGVPVALVGGLMLATSGVWLLAAGSGVADPDASLGIDAAK